MACGVIDSLCNEQLSASLYIEEGTHYRSFTSNKTSGEHPWRTDAPKFSTKTSAQRRDHCGVQYHARRGRLLTERSTAVWIFALPSPLDNLETLSQDAFDARQQGATGELPGSEEGFIRVLDLNFSICLPWCKYFGIGRFCCFIGW